MKRKILFIIGSLAGGVYQQDIPPQVNIIPLYENKKNRFVSKLEHRIYRHFRISYFESARIKRKVADKYNAIISFLEGEPLKFHSYISSRGIKNITWVHIDLLEHYNTVGYVLSKKHELMAYEKMDEIVFVSKDAMKQFKRRFNLQAKHTVIYNPINQSEIIKQSINNDIKKEKFTICTIGRLCEQKAFDRFIRVAKMIKDAGIDCSYWIIGEGPLKSELQHQCDALNMSNDIHFLGFQKPPYPWLKKADIFLSTSIAEGYPLVLCEALCLGIPIVATKCTGPIELLEDNVYGILTDQTDESIYTGLKKLIDDKELLNHYKEMSVKRSSIFNVNRTMDEIYSLFN
jgi:glycosyltransferase involved in cell wall biosynthesis